MVTVAAEPTLPDDVDRALWFHGACGQVDYLVRDNSHTHPGRMSAYCPHRPDHPDYNISIYDIGACAESVRCGQKDLSSAVNRGHRWMTLATSSKRTTPRTAHGPTTAPNTAAPACGRTKCPEASSPSSFIRACGPRPKAPATAGSGQSTDTRGIGTSARLPQPARSVEDPRATGRCMTRMSRKNRHESVDDTSAAQAATNQRSEKPPNRRADHLR